ncbi:unnamed protein product [Tenebrio molitor]|nr:unnamed protein product [Tenebrio molitor]
MEKYLMSRNFPKWRHFHGVAERCRAPGTVDRWKQL